MRRLAGVLLAFAVVVAASCGGEPPGSLAIPASHEAPASSVIGPEGGSVTLPSGTSVTVPAGALDRVETVTIRPSSSPRRPGTTLVGAQYTFGPEGATFSRPVTVTIAYDPKLLPSGKTVADVKVFTAPVGTTSVTWLPTTPVDATHVSAPTTHFSDVGPGLQGPLDSNANVAACKAAPTTCAPVVPENVNGSFCGQFRMASDLAPHAKSRLGRVAYDAQCSRHPNLLCVSDKVNLPVSAKPTGCVDVEVIGGPSGAPVDDPHNHALQCVECPTRPDATLLPNSGQSLCGSDEVQIAHDGQVIFNINGFDVDSMTALYAKALDIRAQQQAHPDRFLPSQWTDILTRIVRTLALELNYCGARAWGLPSPNPSGGTWRYDDRAHRPELSDFSVKPDVATVNSGSGTPTGPDPCPPPTPAVSPSGAGAASSADYGSSPMATQPPKPPYTSVPGLEAHLFAFYSRSMQVFDLDGLAVGLIHEMRHMATPEWGAGDPHASVGVQDAEHDLNELEDYEEMFNHPYLVGVPAPEVALLRNLYDQGRDILYHCFQGSWGRAGGPPAQSGSLGNPFAGYPDDTGLGPMAVGLPGMGGFGGMMPIMPGMAGPLARATRRDPMPFACIPRTERPSCLTVSHLDDIAQLATPKERCAVASWAADNRWMHSKMIRSLSIAADSPREWRGQPWNTLAHYVMGLPFRGRVYPPCAEQSQQTSH